MKLAGLLLPALFLAACSSGPTPTTDATAEAKPIIENLFKAWATLDTSKAAPFYSKDASLAFYDVSPLKYQGYPAYEKGFLEMSKDWKSFRVTLNSDFKAQRQADLMVASSTARIEIEPKQGATILGTLRLTEVLERHKGGWVVIHEHVSMPMPAAAAENKPAPEKAPAKKAKTHKRKR